MKKLLTPILFSAVTAGYFAFTSPSYAQSGLAEAFCQSHIPILYQAIEFRRQGIPIDIALSSSDSAFNLNRSLGIWLRGAIQAAYSQPDKMLEIIDNGTALRSCTASVRGY